MSPEDNILWHIANGYNAMVISEHNNLEGALVTQKLAREKYNDKIKVLIGTEYVNLLFLQSLTCSPVAVFT